MSDAKITHPRPYTADERVSRRPKAETPSTPDWPGKEGQLAQSCADFEALFIHKLFQSMWATVVKSGLIDGGLSEDIYTTMLDQHVARDLALRGSMGLSSERPPSISPDLTTVARMLWKSL